MSFTVKDDHIRKPALMAGKTRRRKIHNEQQWKQFDK